MLALGSSGGMGFVVHAVLETCRIEYACRLKQAAALIPAQLMQCPDVSLSLSLPWHLLALGPKLNFEAFSRKKHWFPDIEC